MKSTPDACRKFMRRALNLDLPLPSAASAVRYHGYIQIDPIDVCGKMHDLILRPRVRDYRPDDLLKTLYRPENREFFEHYIPGRGILVALPVEDYRFLAPSMKKRQKLSGYGGAMSAEQKRMATKILARISEEGPLGAAAFREAGRAMTGWGTAGTLTKTTLDKLFFHGRLLVTRRENFRRIYDLPERVLPSAVLETPPATDKEIKRWLVLERLRQRRLVTLPTAQSTLVKDTVTQVKIDGISPLYCLNEDVALLQTAADLPTPSGEPLLLAPLDPIIYDRKVTEKIWDLNYTWEVYTPLVRRVRGYYALPVLRGTRFVGHVDPKVERKASVLHARVEVEKGTELTDTLKNFAAFLSMKSVEAKRGSSKK